jgi:hypothetical protein
MILAGSRHSKKTERFKNETEEKLKCRQQQYDKSFGQCLGSVGLNILLRISRAVGQINQRRGTIKIGETFPIIRLRVNY